MPELSFPF